MDRAFWTRKPTSPQLNFDLTNLLSHIYDPNAPEAMIAAIPAGFEKPLKYSFQPLDSTIPPTVIFTSSWAVAVFVGGTSGQIHVPSMIAGWSDLMAGPDPTYGACPCFARAARQIFTAAPPNDLLSAANLYLVGHSYGGACCQALALLIRGTGSPLRGVWSYGSPRPGTQRMADLLEPVQNVRWFADGDPVRFIPPHSDENVIIDTFSNLDLVRGMNQQVQTKDGFQIDASGEMLATMGNPSPVHAVGLSIAQWCLDVNGFRSVLHAASEYRRRFQLALPLKPDGPAIPSSQPNEPSATIRPREIAAQQEAAIPLIEAQQAIPTSDLNAEIRSLPVTDPTLRFKRRRDGRIWVVRYGDEVVDVGPGKRRAGRLARAYNRAIRPY